MIELLILACIVIAVLAGTLGFIVFTHNDTMVGVLLQQETERAAWAEERRFLVDRAIARHVGEVVALERENSRANHPSNEDRTPRPLLEGLT